MSYTTEQVQKLLQQKVHIQSVISKTGGEYEVNSTRQIVLLHKNNVLLVNLDSSKKAYAYHLLASDAIESILMVLDEPILLEEAHDGE